MNRCIFCEKEISGPYTSCDECWMFKLGMAGNYRPTEKPGIGVHLLITLGAIAISVVIGILIVKYT